MGLLDDAIREHLELKRLRGADPAEVDRAERDALGPVRRAAEPAAEGTPEAPDAREQVHDLSVEPAEAHFDSGLAADAVEPGPPAAQPIPPTADHDEIPSAPPPSHADPLQEPDDWLAPAAPDPGHAAAAPPFDEHATQVYRPPFGDPATPPPVAPQRPAPPDPDPAAEPGTGPADRPGRPAPPPTGGDPHAPAGEHPEDEEDVLEETPDFLQETPEHDRLWFEQQPPRDFDFDK